MGLSVKKIEKPYLMLHSPRLKFKFVTRQWRVTMQQEAETTGGVCDGGRRGGLR